MSHFPRRPLYDGEPIYDAAVASAPRDEELQLNPGQVINAMQKAIHPEYLKPDAAWIAAGNDARALWQKHTKAGPRRYKLQFILGKGLIVPFDPDRMIEIDAQHAIEIGKASPRVTNQDLQEDEELHERAGAALKARRVWQKKYDDWALIQMKRNRPAAEINPITFGEETGILFRLQTQNAAE